MNLLVVDDHPDCADTLGLLLRSWGHDVRLAGDGPAVLSTLDSFEPQAVFLDLALPGMDGWTIAETLRKAKGFKGLIVTITGTASEDDPMSDRAQELGIVEQLVKPVDPKRLKDLLARFVLGG